MKKITNFLNTWTHWVWSYNDVYETKLEHCPMLDEPEESLDLMESYCKIIVTEGKRREKNHQKDNASYENYSSSVQDAIQNIIRLLSDGREMHNIDDVSHLNLPIKKFDHHLALNGKLPFENDPFYDAQRILEDIPEVRKIIKSSKYSNIFEQFINDNWYYFDGCEDGSMAIRFSKINCIKKKNEYQFTYDGDIVSFETPDSECHGDGVICWTDCEDMPFHELPYFYAHDDIKTPEQLATWLVSHQKWSYKELKENMYEKIDFCLEDLE